MVGTAIGKGKRGMFSALFRLLFERMPPGPPRPWLNEPSRGGKKKSCCYNLVIKMKKKNKEEKMEKKLKKVFDRVG